MRILLADSLENAGNASGPLMKILLGLFVAIVAALLAPVVPSRPNTGGFASAHQEEKVSCVSDFGRCQRAVSAWLHPRAAAPERGVTVTERPGGSANPFTVLREVSENQRKIFQEVQRTIPR